MSRTDEITRRKSDRELNSMAAHGSDYPDATRLAIASELTRRQSIVGIGGWLLLPAIGLVLSPVLLFAALFLGFDTLRDPHSPAIAARFTAWAVGRLILLGALLSFNIVVVLVFFLKEPVAPRFVVALLSASVAVNLVDFLWGRSALASFTPDPDGFIRSVIPAVIWTPYFLTSRRVRQTFVARPPNLALEPSAPATDGSAAAQRKR